MPVDQQPHGVGSIIVRINNEYLNKYGELLIERSTGDLESGFVPSVGFPEFMVQIKSSTATQAGENGVYIRPNGGDVYTCVATGAQDLVQRTLGTPWDLSTAGAATNVGVTDVPLGISFNPDGSQAFVVMSGDTLNEYSLSTNWDLTTISLTNTFDLSSFTIAMVEPWVDPDGGFVLLGEAGDPTIYRFDFGTPFDVTTLSLTDTYEYPDDNRGLAVSPSGDTVYSADTDNELLRFRGLATPFDFGTQFLVQSIDYSHEGAGPDREWRGLDTAVEYTSENVEERPQYLYGVDASADIIAQLEPRLVF